MSGRGANGGRGARRSVVLVGSAPARRVGLHQTLANSRETIHTIPRNALARARPAPILQLEPAAHGRRDFRNTGPRAAARPEPLAVPSTHWARRRPAAPAVGPRRRSRLAARALDRFATNMPAQTPSGARVAALQPDRAARLKTAPPCIAFCHALLHAWSPRSSSVVCSLQPASPNGLEPIPVSAIRQAHSKVSQWSDPANFPRLQQGSV